MSESITIPKITNIGLFDFKLKYGQAQYSEGRRVNAFEIELPISDGGLSYINNNIYPIEKNRVIYAKPGDFRKTKAPFVCQYIHLIPTEGKICEILEKLPDTIKLSDDSKIPSLFGEIIAEYARSGHNFTLPLYEKLLKLIDELSQAGKSSIKSSIKGNRVDIKAVERGVDFINENYMRRLTLKEIAEAAHLSPIYFHKLFFDTVGMTPYEYVLDKRVEKAKALLALTDISISDIAVSVGFTDQAYMGKMFKEKTGMTPLKYRKMQNEIYP